MSGGTHDYYDIESVAYGLRNHEENWLEDAKENNYTEEDKEYYKERVKKYQSVRNKLADKLEEIMEITRIVDYIDSGDYGVEKWEEVINFLNK